MDQKFCHNTGKSPAACPYPHIDNKFCNLPPATQIYTWCWRIFRDVFTFYFRHCIIWLKILKLPIHNISQECLPQFTGRKGILLPNGEVPRHIRQEYETVVILLSLHEWTTCEGCATVHVQGCDSLNRVPYLNQWFCSFFLQFSPSCHKYDFGHVKLSLHSPHYI
jgi:hypothetical protein